MKIRAEAVLTFSLFLSILIIMHGNTFDLFWAFIMVGWAFIWHLNGRNAEMEEKIEFKRV